jgi:RNA polymerase sigma-70 factor (ECF subfamily)
MPTDSQSTRHQTFLALLQPIEAEVEGYARRMVWRKEDLPDVLQNAVLRAFAAFDRYREDASFRGWMFKILNNEIFTINRLHARVSRTEIAVDSAEIDTLEELEAAAAYTDWLASPEALRDALDEDIVEALDSLTEKERSVLLLRAIGTLRYQEIAESLEMPLGSVMGLLSRARHKMRGALKPLANPETQTLKQS